MLESQPLPVHVNCPVVHALQYWVELVGNFSTEVLHNRRRWTAQQVYRRLCARSPLACCLSAQTSTCSRSTGTASVRASSCSRAPSHSSTPSSTPSGLYTAWCEARWVSEYLLWLYSACTHLDLHVNLHLQSHVAFSSGVQVRVALEKGASNVPGLAFQAGLSMEWLTELCCTPLFYQR